MEIDKIGLAAGPVIGVPPTSNSPTSKTLTAVHHPTARQESRNLTKQLPTYRAGCSSIDNIAAYSSSASGLLLAMASAERTVLVLYGSETGNAQDMAEELGRICQRLHFKTDVEELDAVELVRNCLLHVLTTPDACPRALCCSTNWSYLSSRPWAKGTCHTTPCCFGRSFCGRGYRLAV